MQSKICEIALSYARKGIPILFCRTDKKPYTQHGYKDATTDEIRIRQCCNAYPNAMIAIPTGKISNIWCLDVDRPKKDGDPDGLENLKVLLADQGKMPDTWTESTPGGGVHFFFRYPQDGKDVPGSLGKIAPKLDVKSDGGYVIIAPSINDKDKSYVRISATDVPAIAPEWLIRLVREVKKKRPNKVEHPSMLSAGGAAMVRISPYVKAAMEQEYSAVKSASEGERNETINKAAFALGQIVGSGALSEDIARQCIRDAALAMKEPLTEIEIERTIESGITAGMANPRADSNKELGVNVSEESIAASFAVHYGDMLKFCSEFCKWFIWNSDKHIWEVDSQEKVFHYLRQECKKANPSNKPALGKASTAKGVEKFARADPVFATTSECWDSDIFLLGTPRGTVDLKSGGGYARS